MSKYASTKSYSHVKGAAFALSGACLWGLSGNVAQYLFADQSVNAGWLTSFRMISSGLLLLVWAYFREPDSVWKIWTMRASRQSLLAFGLIGMIGAQYTYFEAVSAGNAAIATLLQYISPVILLLYFAFKGHRWPAAHEQVGVLLSTLGVFLIASQGNVSHMSLAPAAVFWGLLSAIGCAVYAALPGKLLRQWGTGIVIGWGMVIGGTVMACFYPPWIYGGRMTIHAFFGILFVIVFGTLVAFSLYVTSLNYLKPIETSLLGCAEPLSAALVSVLWMHTAFTLYDWAGSCCIIGTVFLLSLTHNSRTHAQANN
ncbi:MAG: DMT family transporter [Sporolactobacillus sp.]